MGVTTDELLNHIPELLEICNNQLGVGLLVRDDFQQFIKSGGPGFISIAYEGRENNVVLTRSSLNPNSSPLSQVKEIGGKPIGFCTGKLLEDTDSLIDIFHVDEYDIPPQLRLANGVGIIKTIGVRNDWENSGVEQKLIKDCLNVISANNADYAFSALSSVSSCKVIRNTFLNLGFSEDVVYENYWSDDSRRKGYTCGNCGQAPCLCSASILIKKL